MLAANVSITASSRVDVETVLMIPSVKTDVGTQHLTKYVQNLKNEESADSDARSGGEDGNCPRRRKTKESVSRFKNRALGRGPRFLRGSVSELYAERSLVSKRSWS